MKFGANLGILEPVTVGPDNMARNALWYWEDMYKWLSAANFPGFEVVYKPWDFNLGRSGMPYTRASMETFYGSLPKFRRHLEEIGIPEIAALNIAAGDVVADFQVRGLDDSMWMDGLVEFAKEAVDSAAQLGAEGVVVTPTPDYAYLIASGALDEPDGARKLINELVVKLNEIGAIGRKAGVKIAIRNNYWSMMRGNQIDMIMDALDKDILFSPNAADFYITKADICEKILKYKDRLGFVLLNDTFFEDKHEIYKQPLPEYPQIGPSRVYCMVGNGKVDTTGIVRKLKEISYDGWIICGSHDATNVTKAILNLSWYIEYILKKV